MFCCLPRFDIGLQLRNEQKHHRASLRATTVAVGCYKTFESLAVKLVSRSSAFVAVCIYRPGSAALTSAFFDDLSDLLDQRQLLGVKYVLCGDFNCPGDGGTSLDARLVDIISRYGLMQHVNAPTHKDGNMLDLILTLDSESNFVSTPSVKSVCFSDHHVVCCQIGMRRPPPVTITYSFRRIQNINTAAFCSDISQSKLFDESVNIGADAYAELIDSEVRRILDVHAPMQTRSRRCGRNDCRWLSPEAREAKRLRRRLERKHRRTRLPVDKQAFLNAGKAARDSIMKSRADHIRSKMEEVNGDHRATWRTAQTLLHSKPPIYQDDADCAKLSTSFCQFFADKICLIRKNIATALRSLPPRQFIARSYTGGELSAFRPVTVDEAHRVLSRLPAKSSPLDVLPCRLLKSCAECRYICASDRAIGKFIISRRTFPGAI